MHCYRRLGHLARMVPLIAGMTGLAVADDAPAAKSKTANEGSAVDTAQPMSKAVISRSAMDVQDPQDGYQALQNVAGVTNANSKGTISDNINVRGIPLGFSTSYRLNGGLALANVATYPMEDKERLEALKGANALMFGMASPAGIVNLVTKRATDKRITNVTMNGNKFGAYGAAVDYGEKFGDRKQFGVRMNFVGSHLETGVLGGTGQSHAVSLALDYRPISRLSFKGDFEYYDRKVVEQSTLYQLAPVNGVITVPDPLDPSKLLSGPWAVFHPKTMNYQLRADYIFNNHWKIIAEGGRSNAVRDRMISRISNYNLATGIGTTNITVVRDQKYINTYYKLEALGNFDTGPLKHLLTFGYVFNSRYANVPSTLGLTATQNIFNPIPLATPNYTEPTPTYTPQESRDTAPYVYDNITWGKFMAMVGVRLVHYYADDQLASGVHMKTEHNPTSPGFGLVYNITPDINVYASYMKSLEETGIAPVGTTNQFQILPPASSSQTEFGVRTKWKPDYSLMLAYFQVSRGNAVTNVASNTFLVDGTTKYKGIEGSFSGPITKEVSISAGGQWINAVQAPDLDMTIKDLQPENTPKWAGNIGASYKPAAVKGLTVNLSTNYTARRAINPKNQGFIPGVTLWAASVGYQAKINKIPTNFQLGIDNLFDKRYWASAGSSAYGIGMSRNVKLNVRMNL